MELSSAIRTCGFLLAASLVVASCSVSTGPGEASPSPGATGTKSAAPAAGTRNIVSRFHTQFSDPFDPQRLPSAQGTAQAVLGLYDRLVDIDNDGKLIPYLATSWEVKIDSVTFKLRTDATCADGTPVTPTVVANSLKRLIDPNTKSPSPGQFFGSPPYAVSTDDAAGTVTFKHAPNTEVIYALVFPHVGSIICPAGLLPGADFTKFSYGSGPYTLVSKTADEVVLKRRPDYKWGSGGITASDPGFPETLTFRYVASHTTAANQIVTGGLDFGLGRGPDVGRLVADKSLTQAGFFSQTPEFLLFNHDSSRITADKTVRQALMAAIDPKAWNVAANNGYGTATTAIMPRVRGCGESVTGPLVPNPAGDTDKARSMLLAAGWTAGSGGKLQKDGKPLSIAVLMPELAAAGPEYVAAQLEKMGATTTLAVLEAGALSSQRNAGTWDVTMVPVVGNIPYVSGTFRIFSGGNPPNYGRVNDPLIADLLKTALGDLSCTGWNRYQARLISEAHLLPLAARQVQWFGKDITPPVFLGEYFVPHTLRSTR